MGRVVRGRLCVMLERLKEGGIVTLEELIDTVWPPDVKQPAKLYDIPKLINELRRHGYDIETVRGYRLRGGNRELQTPQAAPKMARRPGVPKTDQAQGGEVAGGNYNYGSNGG
jgi:DNA-binding winged helix-turn-helix (wHTH) protein